MPLWDGTHISLRFEPSSANKSFNSVFLLLPLVYSVSWAMRLLRKSIITILFTIPPFKKESSQHQMAHSHVRCEVLSESYSHPGDHNLSSFVDRLVFNIWLVVCSHWFCHVARSDGICRLMAALSAVWRIKDKESGS
jgi:hypothetical protein